MGEAIVTNCLLSGPFAGKTRVLVTHALHVLPRTDYIYLMEEGKIVEEGPFQSLVSDDKEFARLVREFGAAEKEKEALTKEAKGKRSAKDVERISEKGDLKKKTKLIQDEERERGAVSASVYKAYLEFAGGFIWMPFILLLLTLMQSASGQSSYLHLLSLLISLTPYM